MRSVDQLTSSSEVAETVAVASPLEADEILATLAEASRPKRPPSVMRRILRGLGSAIEWLFGVCSLLVALSLLATLPVLQFLSLGYLLEAGGRIVRQRSVTSGFVGVRKAARVGRVVLGTWLVLLPLRFVSMMVDSARLIEPGSRADRRWTLALWILTALLVVHVIGALFRGGRVRHFVWPAPIRLARMLRKPGAYAEARDAVWEFVVGLRLPYYFWLGLRGFAGGFLWLVLPISLLAAGQTTPALGFVGGLLLACVVMYLPFAQVQFAAQNRFRAMFDTRSLRNHFRRAPWAFAISLACTLLFAVPLYLLKIEILPREAAWLPSLVFVLFIFPARLLVGWAYARAERRSTPRHWFWRHSARLAVIPVAAIYVLVVFFTQFTSWYGVASLYEQHAFLLPVPFLGL